MMKAFLGTLQSILAITFLSCKGIIAVAYSSSSVDSFKNQLDWLCLLDKIHMEHTEDYQMEFEVSITAMNIKNEFSGIYTQFADIITVAADISKMLVKEDTCGRHGNRIDEGLNIPDIIISEFFRFLPMMNNSLAALFDKIVEWQSSTEITKITDAQPKKWLTDNGFQGDTLKETALEEVRNKLDSIVGKGKALQGIMTFYATSFFLTVPRNTISKLAWLYILVATINKNEGVRISIVDEINAILPGRGEELVEELKKVVDSGNAAARFYPFSLTTWSGEIYVLPLGRRYIEQLIDTCEGLRKGHLDMQYFKNEAANNPSAKLSTNQLYVSGLSVYYDDDLKRRAMDQVLFVLREGGPFTNVSDILNEFVEKRKFEAEKVHTTALRGN